MSCCGKSREEWKRQIEGQPVVFEYEGLTGLRAVGPVSGITYRFDRPGSRITIDGRDRTALARVPMLKRIS